MPIINLKQQYPHLYDEILLDVSDPIFEVYDLSRKGENNYDRRRRYHHAYFSLDAGDGIENCATYRTPSPEEIWMQKICKEQLREALEHLPVVQSRRVYAYYILLPPPHSHMPRAQRQRAAAFWFSFQKENDGVQGRQRPGCSAQQHSAKTHGRKCARPVEKSQNC